MTLSRDNPDSNFRRLTKELRTREALIKSTRAAIVNRSRKEEAGTARSSPTACPMSPATMTEMLVVAATTAGAHDESDTIIELAVAGQDISSTGQSSIDVARRKGPSLRSRFRRRALKNKRIPRQCVCARSTTTIRRPRQRKDTGPHASDGGGMASSSSGGGNTSSVEKLDSRVEATTTAVRGMFESGVSAAAVRRLYRLKRRDNEQKKQNARALKEARRSSRAQRSERVSLWEEASRDLLLARQGKYDDGAGGEASKHRAPGGGESSSLPEAYAAPAMSASVGGGALASIAAADNPVLLKKKFLHVEEEEGEGEEKEDRAYCCVLGELDWRQALNDDSHAAELSRDIKRELRAGRTVDVRALRGETSEAMSSLADCRLVLRALYMRCVQFCADPALPPILLGKDGRVRMTMEPSKRYKRVYPGRSSSSGSSRASHSTRERVAGSAEWSGSHYLPPIDRRVCSY